MTTNRKPPPNPWPELRRLREDLSRAIAERDLHRDRADNSQARAKLLAEQMWAMAAERDAYRERRWYRPNTDAIKVAQARVRETADKLYDFDVRHARLQPGAIQGFPSRS